MPDDLLPGDPAPRYRQRSFANPRYVFDAAAGRYLVLCLLGSAADPHSAAALAAVRARTDLFDDRFASFFAVSIDPADASERRIVDRYPGYRVFWDDDLTISRLYGAAPPHPANDKAPAGPAPFRRRWVVIDPTLRILQVLDFRPDRGDIDAVLSFLGALPPPQRHTGLEMQAPVVLLPNVFEPAFCRKLIDLYDTHGGEPSGFMREDSGRTVLQTDPSHKVRRDHDILDDAVIAAAKARVARRVAPEVAKVFQFHVTRMERYIVACYTAEEGGHFAAHRDNTTKGRAHRRFAVSINLNDDFEGGALGFPEYGPRGFHIPAGAAVVFSCALLHTVSPVTRGRRYAFLPFLYDDAAARIREANNRFLAEGVPQYTQAPGTPASQTAPPSASRAAPKQHGA